MEHHESFVQGISEILVKKRVISEDDAYTLVEDFEQSSKSNFDDFLLEEGLVSEEDLLQALSEYYQVESFDVVGYFFDHELLTNFPKDFLLRNAIIPVTIDQNFLLMVAANPDQENLIVEINKHVPNEIEFYVGFRRDITDQIKEFYDLSITEMELDENEEEEQKEYEDIVEEEE